MKKFSKLRIFETLGLFAWKFDCDKLKIESSFYPRLKSHLILLFKVVVLFKIYLSNFFGRHDLTQLAIGNLYLYLPDMVKRFIGIIVSVTLQIGCFDQKNIANS